MAATESSLSPSPPPFLPANRKRCFVCKKCVYSHQPILFCTKCEQVFHGKCLNINNSLVFTLQQVNWFCDSCSTNNNMICNACVAPINIKIEPMQLCNNCYKPAHKSCTFNKLCLHCIPEFQPSKYINPNPQQYQPEVNITPLDNDYYQNLPYFNPFEELSEKMPHELTECDEIYENFSVNSLVLNNCEYLHTRKFVENVRATDSNKFILIGLNIDGFKTNFDNFKIFCNDLFKAKVDVSCFSLCETNILESESDSFYIDGYNKFILDKLTLDDKTYKKKGSGIAIYLTKKINNAQKDIEHCLSTPDIEILTVSFALNENLTHYIIGVYRSPSGNFDKFIESFDLILTKLN